MSWDETVAGIPDALLGVVSPQVGAAEAGAAGRARVPVEDRERLCRTAAEILQGAGAVVSTGEIIVLAGWLGGLD